MTRTEIEVTKAGSKYRFRVFLVQGLAPTKPESDVLLLAQSKYEFPTHGLAKQTGQLLAKFLFMRNIAELVNVQ